MTAIYTDMDDDDWSSHVMNGEAFTGEAIRTAVGGMLPQLQLLNPSGLPNPVRLRLRCLEPMPFIGGPINTNIRREDTPLANLQAVPFGVPQNLLGSGLPPVAEIRDASVAVLTGSPFWLILTAGFNRRSYAPKTMEWAHDLLPGQGIMMSGGLGGFLITGWQWVEIPL